VLVPPPAAMEMCSGLGSGLGSASTLTSPTTYAERSTEPNLLGLASMPVLLGLGYHLVPLQ
jgi:hypothetical protein